MTEEQWLGEDDLPAKLHFLGERASFRRARLFAVACGRTVGAIHGPPVGREALGALERLADDPDSVDRHQLHRTFRRARGLFPTGIWGADEFAHLAVTWAYFGRPDQVMGGAVTLCAEAEARTATGHGWNNWNWSEDSAERTAIQRAAFRRYGALLLDVIGNPFRPVAWDAAWRTPDVLGVALAIYEEGAFDRMPVLGDALLDAGCEEDTVIGHCRHPGPHVRGCWVVDGVLGKG